MNTYIHTHIYKCTLKHTYIWWRLALNWFYLNTPVMLNQHWFNAICPQGVVLPLHQGRHDTGRQTALKHWSNAGIGYKMLNQCYFYHWGLGSWEGGTLTMYLDGDLSGVLWFCLHHVKRFRELNELSPALIKLCAFWKQALYFWTAISIDQAVWHFENRPCIFWTVISIDQSVWHFENRPCIFVIYYL